MGNALFIWLVFMSRRREYLDYLFGDFIEKMKKMRHANFFLKVLTND